MKCLLHLDKVHEGIHFTAGVWYTATIMEPRLLPNIDSYYIKAIGESRSTVSLSAWHICWWSRMNHSNKLVNSRGN